MTPLPLSGTTKWVSGAAVHGRHLLRLRDANSGPVGSADTAIVRHLADLYAARERGYGTAIVFDSYLTCEYDGFDTLIGLDGQFRYLATGDVIAFDPGFRRFRVLFRRASQHNSFLVTERCNHYCLMCSQPPRRHCQVASGGRVMGKTSNAGVRLQTQLRQHRATSRKRHCEPCDTGWR